jgi:CTP:molybdopterin cytidylyltransferase MocA
MTRVVGVVLAAGSGSRMGTPKAELAIDGLRLVDHAVAVLGDGGCTPIVVVARAGTTVAGAHVIVNGDPDRGMRSSLRLAVDAAGDDETIPLAVLLVDTPGITAESVRAVVDGWTPGRVAIATYGGRRGHPTVMPVALWRRALTLAGPDEGARAFLRAEPSLVDEIPADGDPTDLDTKDDLTQWIDQRSPRSGRSGRPQQRGAAGGPREGWST